MMRIKPTTSYVLKALIPYSKANAKLLFKPRSFFYELEAKSKLKERSLRSAYYRALKAGLIEMDNSNVPHLTSKGLFKVNPYKPTKLNRGSYLLISFDIPETERVKRNHLRMLLRELSCTKIQQSLWSTKYDHRSYLKAKIKDYGLENYIVVYEAVRLPIN